MIRERRGVIQSLVNALSVKPFLLLAGISGSGKTQLARRIAAGLAAGHAHDGLYTGALPDAADAATLRAALVANRVTPDLDADDDPDAFLSVHDLPPAAPSDDAHANLRALLRDRVAFVPVRPDWTDAQKIWGYYNPLTGLYYPTDALRVALHAYLEFVALGDRAPRHFIILDELNLARVEYYLSDLLSLMECPCVDTGDAIRLGESVPVHPFHRPLWTQSAPQMSLGATTSSHEQLFLSRMDTAWTLAFAHLDAPAGALVPRLDVQLDQFFFGASWSRLIPPHVVFSPNLSIIGTVNVDETTFSFSPKVLDRAFVLEFNDVDYDQVCAAWPSYDTLRPDLLTLHDLLRPANLHFGYRVVHELTAFLNTTGGDWATHGDFLLMSKILPKLRGAEDRLRPVLPPLLAYALTGLHDPAALRALAPSLLPPLLAAQPLTALLPLTLRDTPRFPRAADKLHRMTRQLLETGLASYF